MQQDWIRERYSIYIEKSPFFSEMTIKNFRSRRSHEMQETEIMSVRSIGSVTLE